MNRIIGMLLFLMLIMTGCNDSPDSDVINFVSKTKKRESKLQELPPIKNPEPFFYEGRTRRDPFSTQIALRPSIYNFRSEVRSNYTGPMPDLKRRREILEEYALDTLIMVGVISKGGKYWALVKDSAGIVHRVGVGNYLGQNYGKIVDINESSITLNELIPDEEGGWRERKQVIKLQ